MSENTSIFKLTDEEYELMHELGLYHSGDKPKLLKLYLENLVLHTRQQVYRELGLIIEVSDLDAPIPFELTPKALTELYGPPTPGSIPDHSSGPRTHPDYEFGVNGKPTVRNGDRIAPALSKEDL